MKRFLLISLMLGSACAFFVWSMIELKREMDRQTAMRGNPTGSAQFNR